MATINEKTKIPLGWAIAIVATLVGLASNFGVAHWRLNSAEATENKLQARTEKVEADIVDQKIQSGKVGVALENISKKLDELDKKLDRAMERRGHGKEE